MRAPGGLLTISMGNKWDRERAKSIGGKGPGGPRRRTHRSKRAWRKGPEETVTLSPRSRSLKRDIWRGSNPNVRTRFNTESRQIADKKIGDGLGGVTVKNLLETEIIATRSS